MITHRAAGFCSVVTLSFCIGALLLHSSTRLAEAQGTCADVLSGLAGWWPAEGNAKDIVATNNGTVVNDIAFGPGKVGQAFYFDGWSSYITNNVPGLTNVLNSYTMEFWANPTEGRMSTAEGTSGILGTENQRYAVFPNNGKFGAVGSGVSVGTNGVSVFEHGSAYNPALLVYDGLISGWTHIAVIYSNQQPSLYLNGILVRTGLVSTRASYPSTLLGEGGADYGYYAGWLDEVSIYNRALSASEVSSIYQAGSAGKCPPPVAPFILVQPTNRTASIGGTAMFTVGAGGSAPLSYQWTSNGTNIAGATLSAFVLTNVQASHAGVYSVTVSNFVGTTNSLNAILTVIPCTDLPSGLVSWWPAEGSGDDIAGTNDSMVLGTQYASGKVGQAFSFNGSSASVSNSTAAIRNIVDSYTIEFWAKPSAARASTAESTSGLSGTAGNQRFAVFPDGAGGTLAGAGISVGTNGVSVFEHTSDYLPSLLVHNASLTDWTHIAVVYSNRVPRLYLNGGLARVGLMSEHPSNPSIILGGRVWNGLDYGFYSGLLDEVSIYGRPLLASEIQAIYAAGASGKCFYPQIIDQPVSQTGFVGDSITLTVHAMGFPPLTYQWARNGTNLSGASASALSLFNLQLTDSGNYAVKVSNPYGSVDSATAVLTVTSAPPCLTLPTNLVSWWRAQGNAFDHVGGNSGTLIGQVAFGAGRVGPGFVLDGNADAIDVGNPLNLRLQDFTIEAWIKRSSAASISLNGSLGMIFAYGANGYGLYLDGNGLPALSKINVNAISPNSPLIADTVFHHLAVTKSGSTVTFYIDGVAYSAPNYNPGFTFTTTAQIGAWSSSQASSFFGTIDELAVFNRALTALEIQSIYTAGVGGKCATPFPASVVVQPTNTSVQVTSNTVLSVGAGGTPPFTFQWRRNGTNIPGATSPLLTLTNLQLNQSGIYAVSITNATGFVISSNAMLTVNPFPAVVRLASTNGPSGGIITLPVLLSANGNENALSFSLAYVASRLTYVGASVGPGAPGASLLLNTTATNGGQLGVGIALPPGALLAAGTQEVARLQFEAATVSVSTLVQLTLGDQPTPRQLLSDQLALLPAWYSNGSISISAAVAYESDVFPRPGGDTNATFTDWLTLGRYAARLDYPTNASEFQRADCAPRTSRGDGALRVSDWVQAGRYAAGLESLTAAAGPTNEISGPGPGTSNSRILGFGNLNFDPNQIATNVISLNSLGNENALGFTFSFDTSRMSFVSASLGNDAAAATLNLNTNQAPVGRLGAVLALPVGSSFVAGTQQVLRIAFRAGMIGGTVPCAFTDVLVPREISDAAGQPLPAGYGQATITVNAPPALAIVRGGTNIYLAWPASAAGYTLQEAAGNLRPAVVWMNVPTSPIVSNNQNVVQLPLSSTNRYFRLFHP